MSQTPFIRHPRDFFNLMTSDDIEVIDCYLVNEDCIYVTHRNEKGFDKGSPNTNTIIASYVTSHARLVLYEYLEKCKAFTLNKLTSDYITLDTMRTLAISKEDNTIVVTHSDIRSEAKRQRVCPPPPKETKIYRRTFDKRVRRPDHTSVPYGYR